MNKYYRNCDEIPVYNFYKLIETRDYSYMYIDFDGFSEIKVEPKIAEVWEVLYEEYLKLVDDNTMLMYYELMQELTYLETRFKIAEILLYQISIGGMGKEVFLAYVKELGKWKYHLDINKPLGSELERLVTQLRGSQNKINIKREEKKELEKKNKGESLSLVEQQVRLEQSLNRNEIDLSKTTISKWIALVKQVKLINKERVKKNGK